MVAKTQAQRAKDRRDRKIDRGEIKREYWGTPIFHAKLREFADSIIEKPSDHRE
jgi:hypothetical protein